MHTSLRIVVGLAMPRTGYAEQRCELRIYLMQRDIDHLNVRIRKLIRSTNYHADIIWTMNKRIHDLEVNLKAFLVRVEIEWVDHMEGEVHEHGDTNITEDSGDDPGGETLPMTP